MSEIPQTRSIRQRDAWLSITACFLLQIFVGSVLLHPALNILSSVSKLTLGYVSVIFILLFPVIYLSFRYGTINISDFLLRRSDFTVLFVALIILVIIHTPIFLLHGHYKSYTFYGQKLSQLPGFEYFIVLLATCFIIPFLEETLFRRYIFELFRNKYRIPTALFLTAFTGTLLHIGYSSITALIGVFFSMIFFTLIYFKSRLGVSIAIHCLTNILKYFF